MTKRRISIDNLRIKLPRSMRHDAHSIASSMGNDVARSLANAASAKAGNVLVDEIAVGRVQDISVVGKKVASNLSQILEDRGRN